MLDMGISEVGVFEKWLDEEKTYLQGLTKEPKEETLQMEYFQKLINLWASEYVDYFFSFITLLTKPRATLTAANGAFANTEPGAQDFTRAIETKRRHAIEKHDKDLNAVHALELQLGCTSRWVLGSPEFEEAAKMASMRKYQRCIDDLEGLVVARIFELTKMNRSQTGRHKLHLLLAYLF